MIDEPAGVEAVVEAVEDHVVGARAGRPERARSDAGRRLQILRGVAEHERLSGRARRQMDADDVDGIGAGEVAERRLGFLRDPQLLLRRERDVAQVLRRRARAPGAPPPPPACASRTASARSSGSPGRPAALPRGGESRPAAWSRSVRRSRPPTPRRKSSPRPPAEQRVAPPGSRRRMRRRRERWRQPRERSGSAPGRPRLRTQPPRAPG